MSRLRRLVLSDRFFFVTCRLLPKRRILSESEFACLAGAIQARRKQHGFLLTAWVFLPDHWHAILFPRHPLSREDWDAILAQQRGSGMTLSAWARMKLLARTSHSPNIAVPQLPYTTTPTQAPHSATTSQ